MSAIIYQKSKCYNQVGIYSKDVWHLKIIPIKNSRKKFSIMNWVSNDNMDDQINLHFVSKELAVSYAKKHNLKYEIIEPNKTQKQHKSYADNFTKPLLS